MVQLNEFNKGILDNRIDTMLIILKAAKHLIFIDYYSMFQIK